MLIDSVLEGFDPQQGELVDEEEVSLTGMEVRRKNDLRWMVSKDGILHGVMSEQEPNYPLMPHLKAMFVAFLVRPSAKTVLNIGLGTGSIERYCSDAYRNLKVTTVEISQDIYDLARLHFVMPKNSHVVIEDASSFLKRKSASYDIIFSDALDVEKNKNLIYSNNFLGLLNENLSKNGVIALNYIFVSDEDLLSFLLKLRKIFKYTALMKVKNHLNIIIIATNHSVSISEMHDAFSRTHESKLFLDQSSILREFEWLPTPFIETGD